MPERIQRKHHSTGWVPPIAAKYVGRPTAFGNPFKIKDAIEWGFATNEDDARILVVDCFRDWLYKGDLSDWWSLNNVDQHAWIRKHLVDLRGRDLICWCPLWTPEGSRGACHADVYLQAANPGLILPAKGP